MGIEKAREAQVQRERQEKIRQRKLEAKRVDHLSRALREEEKTRLNDWADNIHEEDSKFLDEAQDRDESDQKAKHEAGLAEKNTLIVFEEQKNKWVEEQLASKYEAHMAAVQEKIKQARVQAAKDKIQRAKAARAEHEKGETAKQAAAQRKEEEQQRKEENERKRVQEE